MRSFFKPAATFVVVVACCFAVRGAAEPGEDAVAEVAEAVEKRPVGWRETVAVHLTCKQKVLRGDFPFLSAKQWKQLGLPPIAEEETIPLKMVCEAVLAGEKDAVVEVAEAVEKRPAGWRATLAVHLTSKQKVLRGDFPFLSAKQWKQLGLPPISQEKTIPLKMVCEAVLAGEKFEEVHPVLLAAMKRIPADAEKDGAWRPEEGELVHQILKFLGRRYTAATPGEPDELRVPLDVERGEPVMSVPHFPSPTVSMRKVDLPAAWCDRRVVNSVTVTHANRLALAERLTELAVERAKRPAASTPP